MFLLNGVLIGQVLAALLIAADVQWDLWFEATFPPYSIVPFEVLFYKVGVFFVLSFAAMFIAEKALFEFDDLTRLMSVGISLFLLGIAEIDPDGPRCMLQSPAMDFVAVMALNLPAVLFGSLMGVKTAEAVNFR